MTTHMAWRWNTTHELPKSRRACTDDADRTMTRPTTTRALTSIASRTNSGVDRDLEAERVVFVFVLRAGAGRRRARTRSVVAATRRSPRGARLRRAGSRRPVRRRTGTSRTTRTRATGARRRQAG